MNDVQMGRTRRLRPYLLAVLGAPLGLVASGAVPSPLGLLIVGALLAILLVDIVLLPHRRLPQFLFGGTIVGLGLAMADSDTVAALMSVGRFVAPSALLLVLLGFRRSHGVRSLKFKGKRLPIALTILAGLSLVVSIDITTSALKFCALALVAVTTVFVLRWDSESSGQLYAPFVVALIILVVTNGLVIMVGNSGYFLGRFRGWTSNANALGLICGITIPVLIAGATTTGRVVFKRALLAFMVITALILFLTGSRAGLLAAVLGGITVLRNARLASSLFLPVVLAAVLVVGPLAVQAALKYEVLTPVQRAGDSGREEVWAVGWHEMREHPWLGAGFATTEDRFLSQEFGRFHVFQGAQFHNSYLEAGVELGVPAALLLCSAGLLSFSYLIRPVPSRNRWAAGVVVAAATMGVFETGLLTPGSFLFFPFWLALGVLTLGERPRSSRRGPPQSVALHM